ncbi:MAG TPA: sodium:calcium antiporter, partial [Planctomycetota bacterium]|nr:sodium:calcium antiporter [Planctomycetota bacterium]
AVRGERDIAVGNVVGSNIFNVLAVLGLGSLVAPDGIPVPPSSQRFDVPVMIAVSVACLPVFFIGRRINRWEGALFLGYYAVYTTWLVLSARGDAAMDAFGSAMTAFVLPLTGVTLAVFSWRAMDSKPKDAA